MNKLNKAQKEAVKNFASVTESTDKIALEMLKSAEWDTDTAFELYYAQHSGPPARGGGGGARGGAKLDASSIEAAYKKYKDANSDMILADGVFRMCEDLAVDPGDVAMLVLAWHCRAAAMCEFSRAELTAGLSSLGVDSVAKLATKLPALRASLADDATFRAVYAFTFAFARDKGAKNLPADTALALWQLLLPQRWGLGAQFCEFVPSVAPKVITADTWAQLGEFMRNVSPDMSNFDPNGAWPSLIDDFAESIIAKAAPTQ